jgi:hypothetical protein
VTEEEYSRLSWRQRMVRMEKDRKQAKKEGINLLSGQWRNKSLEFLRDGGSIKIK